MLFFLNFVFCFLKKKMFHRTQFLTVQHKQWQKLHIKQKNILHFKITITVSMFFNFLYKIAWQNFILNKKKKRNLQYWIVLIGEWVRFVIAEKEICFENHDIMKCIVRLKVRKEVKTIDFSIDNLKSSHEQWDIQQFF